MHPDDCNTIREVRGGASLPPQRWLRTTAAANYTGLGESTLEKKRLTGGGPPFVKCGTRVVYDRNDLDRWLEERKVRSTSEPVRAA